MKVKAAYFGIPRFSFCFVVLVPVDVRAEGSLALAK